jgi:hypothetical protein
MKTKDFILYVDFDSTLYNTKAFAADHFALIAQYARVYPKEIADSIDQFFSHPGLGGYDYNSHIEFYGLDPKIMWQKLEELVQHNNYLYPDSARFIQNARQKGYDPKILSFGEQRFQLIKIRPTLEMLAGKYSKPIEVSVVDRKKHAHIRALHMDQHGALIDDVPDQELPDGFTEIHIDRSLEPNQPTKKDSGFTISDLDQALEIIESLTT